MADLLRTTYLTDGAKSIALKDLPEDAWNYLTGGEAGGSVRDAFRSVPWLFRGGTMRADAVADLPFAIYKGDKSIDDSDDYQNTVGFLPNLRRLLYLVELSLTLSGRAYLFHNRNMLNGTLSLRYLAPHTIRPKIDKVEGLTHFERTVGGKPQPYEIEDIVYFWLPDDQVEEGEPRVYPGLAALKASGVLKNVDLFAENFFGRGAIKATLLTVEGGAADAEKKKLKAWWRRAFEGIAKSWSTEVVNAGVKPVVIGEGIQELSNQQLTREKREDIATALGIPHTLLFSDAANYATAEVDDRAFIKRTISPDAHFIASVLNDQVLVPQGYRMKFRPETLDIFQEDEEQRSGAFLNYVRAGIPRSVAAQMLGLEMPDGVEFATLDTYPMPNLGGVVLGNSDPVRTPERNEQRSLDLERWRRKALNRLEKGQPASCDFDSDHIEAARHAAILGALEAAKTVEDVKAIFADEWMGYP